MSSENHIARLLLSAALGIACAAPAVLGQVAAAPAAAPAAAGVLANLTSGKTDRDMYLLRVDGDKLYVRPLDAQPGIAIALDIAKIEKVNFKIDYSRAEAFRAIRGRAWADAAGVIIAACRPMIAFIELPNNNALEPALEAAHDFWMLGIQIQRLQGDKGADAAGKAFGAAQYIYERAARATWSSQGEVAGLRAILCQIQAGKVDQAVEALKNMREPQLGDAAYGLYWGAKAEISLRQQAYRDAVNEAVRAVVFDNKDGALFPEMLFLSARCYEELLEVHRARDVYYEIARLFSNTEWGDLALVHLRTLMQNGSSREPEKVNIAKVFFGLDEDMNAVVDKFLASVTAAPKKAANTNAKGTGATNAPNAKAQVTGEEP